MRFGTIAFAMCGVGLLWWAFPVSGHVERVADGFDTLSPAWSQTHDWGTIEPTAEVVHAGRHAMRFAAAIGNQRQLFLTRRLPEAVTGRASVSFYDTTVGHAGLYAFLELSDSRRPAARVHVGVLDWGKDLYAASVPGQDGSALTDVRRTTGWHRLDVRANRSEARVLIDGRLADVARGDCRFDTAALQVFGPGWRPNATYYFDDFELTTEAPGRGGHPGALTGSLALLALAFLPAARTRALLGMRRALRRARW